MNRILQTFSFLVILVTGSGYAHIPTNSVSISGVNSELVTKRAMQEKRVKVNGIELQVRDYAGNGDIVVFLHYGGGNLMMWQRMLPYFNNDYRLVLIDFRGHGKSDVTPTGYHIDQLASDIVGVMKELKINNAHIVGSSTGAEVGLSIGANYPEKVSSLILEGALVSQHGPYSLWKGSEQEFQKDIKNKLKKRRNFDRHFPSVQALVEYSSNLYPSWTKFDEVGAIYGTRKTSEGKFTNTYGSQQGTLYMKHYYQYLFEDYFRKIKAPFLIIGGEGDFKNSQIIKAQQRLIELALSKGKIKTLDNWQHADGWTSSPEYASKIVLDFLADKRN
mgnify:CR=1 FL=1